MRDRKKRNVIIGILFATLIFMGVGFSIISQNLSVSGVSKVNGNFDIVIESITPTTVGQGQSVSETIDNDKLSLTFQTRLFAPGDKVVYNVVIKNNGTIAAKLDSVSQNISNNNDNYVIYSNDIENGTVLQPKEKYSFKITSEFNQSIVFIDPNKTVNATLELDLNFVQFSSDPYSPTPGATVLYTGYGNLAHTTTWSYYSDGTLVVSGNGELTGSEAASTPQDLYDTLYMGQKIIGSAIMANYNKSISDVYQSSNHGLVIPDDVMNIGEDEYFANFCIWSDDYITYFAEQNGVPGVTSRSGLISVLGQMGMDTTDITTLCSYIPQIRSIVIDEGITSIGLDAFEELGFKGGIIIPSTVTLIDEGAFSNNFINSLTFAGAEDGTSQLNKISYDAFRNTMSIGSLYLPGSLTYIGDYAFYNAGITSAVINGHYTGSGAYFSNYAFMYNMDLYLNNISLGNDTDLTQEMLEQYYNMNESKIHSDGGGSS